MEKEKLLTVGQVAEITNLPKSKIRYWDDMNLLTSSRNQHNGYRMFDMEDILTISDIDFYRRLDIPINKMTNLYRKSPEELWAILDETEKRVAAELAELEKKKQGIKHRKDQLLSLIELKEKEFLDEPLDIERIIPIDLKDPNELHAYIDNPSSLVVYIDSKNEKEITYGFAVTTKEFVEEVTIWQQPEQQNKSYKQFLLTIKSDDPLENNFQSIKGKLEQQGYQTGTMVGRYIMTAEEQDGFYRDYYKAWVEVSK
ncbi:MerR family transcriptional regulator [Candidatus Enterococcus ikei]|uniref:MerR family transcriptional regulator n=1 Tax=Candidatus Enterococcus ikei TaxID=2815326 RepID=A0ABS3GYH8_9ENTE|nr:MerR family transcriptional regulator [Enterococcus sp. DIV0869a]MBO0439895.1 MerR family transcriptional regulator [Enterococcus sp. DIV0869a]